MFNHMLHDESEVFIRSFAHVLVWNKNMEIVFNKPGFFLTEALVLTCEDIFIFPLTRGYTHQSLLIKTLFI